MMGCWNHTCAITTLPIMREEDVVVILLKETVGYKSLCYPFYYHLPLPLTFRGQYNEYGRVENCTGPALSLIVDGLQKYLVDEDAKADFNVDSIFSMEHDSQLLIKEPFIAEQVEVNHIVIKQQVYDNIVHTMRLTKWNPERHEDDQISYLDIRDTIPNYIKDVRKLAKLWQSWKTLSSCDVSQVVAHEMAIKSSTIGTILSARSGNGYSGVTPIHVSEALVDIATNTEGDDQLRGIIDNAIRFFFVMQFYIDARMSFTLPSGKGSQDAETAAQELRAALTVQHATEIAHMWDEEE